MSSSSSSITSTTVNGRSVVSGLSSGIDVDSIVDQLITAESTKLNRMKQKQELLEWKQTAYRDIISDIQAFSDKYFDTSASNSIMNKKTFQQFSITSSSSAVTASYTSNAAAGSHTIKVSQLATAASLTTSGNLSKEIQGSTSVSYSSLSGTSFVISVDGTQTTVSLDDSVTNLDSLQAAIDDAVGKGKVTVSEDSSGILSFTPANDIKASSPADFSSLSGKSFLISLDGAETTVTLDSTVTGLDSLQTAIDNAVGSGKVKVTADDSGMLSIQAADNSNIEEITLSDPTDSSSSALSTLGFDTSTTLSSNSGVQKITLSAPASSGSTSALTSLGFGTGATLSNRISTSETLATLAGSMQNSFTFNDDSQIDLTINGVNFTFDQDTKLSEMISEINQSDAGVTLKYDDLNDQLVMTASATGAQKSLTYSETGSTFLTAALSTYTSGQDAKATIDGQTLTRSSNTATVNGVTYTFNQRTDDNDDTTVTLTQDIDAVYDSIKSFVDDYNALISTINSKISEEYDSDYSPLTNDQEEAMSDSEIENWNKKAKTGLLQNDSLLQGLLDDLRQSMSISVSGSSITLASIGITTKNYDEKGKLYIDDDKLKQALQDKPTEVLNLFTQQSTSYSGTVTVRKMSSQAQQRRYKEEGISYRFYDIIQKNISTIGDSSGNKGLLLEKAGVEDDTTYDDNTLTDQMNDYKDRIEKEQDRLDDERDRLYTKYSAMETYISKMNSQLSSLSSYLSSGS